MRVVFLLFSAILLSSTQASTRRVLSTLPSFTESIFYLEAQDHLVGVSQYCNYPPQALKLPRYGSSFEINLERLVKERVDTVLLAQVEGGRAKKDLEKLGIKTVIAPYKKLYDSVEMLKVFNTEFELKQDKKISDFHKRLDLSLLPLNNGKKVLIIIGEKFRNGNLLEVRAAGRGNYFSEIVKKLGSKNIINEKGYPIVSIEHLLKMDFDVILRVSDKSIDTLNDWKNSIYKDKIKFISKDYAVILGPRVIKLVEDIRESIK